MVQHRARRRWAQEGPQLLGVLVGRVEPEVEGGGVEDHRHAVVDALHVRAAGRGDDGAAAHVGRVLWRALLPPALRQAGEGDRLAVGPAEIVRLPLAGLRLVPLVEAVGGDDDPPLSEGLAEGGLGGHGLAARVEEPAAGLRVLGPPGDEAPAKGHEQPLGGGLGLAPATLRPVRLPPARPWWPVPDAEDLVGRGDVPAGMECGIDPLGQGGPEVAGQPRRWRVEGEASAHVAAF